MSDTCIIGRQSTATDFICISLIVNIVSSNISLVRRLIRITCRNNIIYFGSFGIVSECSFEIPCYSNTTLKFNGFLMIYHKNS